MENKIDSVFDREHERMHGMLELLTDYLDTVTNEEIPETHNVKKWVASELIIFLTAHVGETHYEMMGILDECKHDLRVRSHRSLQSDNNESDTDD